MEDETKKETRRVVYIGGHYGPEAIFGGGIGPCRVGDGPCDIERELVDPLVEAKVFREATAEDEPGFKGAEPPPDEAHPTEPAGGGKVLDFSGSFGPVHDSIDVND